MVGEGRSGWKCIIMNNNIYTLGLDTLCQHNFGNNRD